MLTANQLILLGKICKAPEPISTAALAEIERDSGDPFGDDAARNALTRIETRGFIVGSGKGRTKTWAPTRPGIEAYDELAPAAATAPDDPPATPDSSPKGPRTYVVLEECSLADAVRAALPEDFTHIPDDFYEALKGKVIYDRVFEPQARNTEHALRQTAKAVYNPEQEPPVLVAVVGRTFRPEPVTLNQRLTVGIG